MLKGRLSAIRPALQRLYRKGELRPGGVRSGVFVKLCLVGDKPFIRHVCGLTSHNADAFGAPMCGCRDKDLYNFSMCKRTHYGGISYETLCHRAHVPLWQALGEPEPDEWKFTCDCCHEVSRAPTPRPDPSTRPPYQRDTHARLLPRQCYCGPHGPCVSVPRCGQWSRHPHGGAGFAPGMSRSAAVAPHGSRTSLRARLLRYRGSRAAPLPCPGTARADAPAACRRFSTARTAAAQNSSRNGCTLSRSPMPT